DGVAIASGFLSSRDLGLLIFTAVILHKVPTGVSLASIMLASGNSTAQTVAAVAVVSLFTVLGAVATPASTLLASYGLAIAAGLADPRRGIPRCDRVLHHPDVVAGSAHVKQPDLFAGHEPPAAPPDPDPADAGLSPGAPLAARMRPRSLDEFVGQEHLLAPGRALRELIEKDVPGSVILWGPPGSGKTTIARIIAERTRAAFVPFSAVTEGVARVREVIREAEARLRATGRRTILFCDEIHRFNKAQQDAFLPHVEAGTI